MESNIGLDGAAEALSPSFAKFGKPTGYVAGSMSNVAEPSIERLYGTGKARRRLALYPENVFLQINGEDLGASTTPVPTVHIVYDGDDLMQRGVPLSAVEAETRRGHRFTVFERVDAGRVLVSVYASEALPLEAEFSRITFLDF